MISLSFRLIVSVLLLTLPLLSAAAKFVVADLHCGAAAVGLRRERGAAFLSLPYGEIPARFAYSRLHACDARATLNATARAPACWWSPPSGDAQRAFSEDCLTLDLFAPTWPVVGRPKPVSIGATRSTSFSSSGRSEIISLY